LRLLSNAKLGSLLVVGRIVCQPKYCNPLPEEFLQGFKQSVDDVCKCVSCPWA
jgi:hypothetical protein